MLVGNGFGTDENNDSSQVSSQDGNVLPFRYHLSGCLGFTQDLQLVKIIGLQNVTVIAAIWRYQLSEAVLLPIKFHY